MARNENEIQKGNAEDYPQLVQVWESSVKATHDFLKPDDFRSIKELLPGIFPQVEVYVIRSGQEIAAFMGVSGDRLEMLFVSAGSRGKGYGKELLAFAVDTLHVRKVDVNEQNIQACGFYSKFGFRTVSRFRKDSMNMDYPILHLEWAGHIGSPGGTNPHLSWS